MGKSMARDGSSPNILAEGALPHLPFINEHIFSVLRKRKNTNFIQAYI